MPRPKRKRRSKQTRSCANSTKTTGKQNKFIDTIGWAIRGILGFLSKPVIFLMATCTTVVAGLGRLCRWPTNGTPASVQSSCSPLDGVAEKGHGMLGAVTALPMNVYKHVQDLLAAPTKSNGTSKPLLGYSGQSESSGTASITSDDVLLLKQLTSSNEELGVDGKEILMAHDRATRNETVEDAIECQNASFLSTRPTRPTKRKGTSANKDNRKATSMQKAQPSSAKPKLNERHLSDNTKARHGSRTHPDEPARTKQRNANAIGILAGPVGKPKPGETRANSGLKQTSGLSRDASKQERRGKYQEIRPGKVLARSLKLHSGQSTKYPASLKDNTVVPNKPSHAPPPSIPEMHERGNKQQLNTAICSTAGRSNAPSHKILSRPQLKSEPRRETAVSHQGKLGMPAPGNSSAQAGSLKTPAPQTTMKAGTSSSEVPSTPTYRQVNKPNSAYKTGALGVQKKPLPPCSPLPQTLPPNVLAPENATNKQHLKVAARTRKSSEKSHKLTDRQPKAGASSKNHPLGLNQNRELAKDPSQAAIKKAPVPKTGKKQPSEATPIPEQTPESITAHRPRNRIQKISDLTSKQHPVSVQEKTRLHNKSSSQKAASNAPVSKNKGDKLPSKTATKFEDAPRSIPSERPKGRPQPIHKPRNKKLPRNAPEKTELSQKAPSSAPTSKNTRNKQRSKSAGKSDEASHYVPSHEPRNRPEAKSERSNKKHPVDFQGEAGSLNKPSFQRTPVVPWNARDDQPPRTTASHNGASSDIPSQNVTYGSGSAQKTPGDSITVDNSAGNKKCAKPKECWPTTMRNQEGPKDDTESEIISRNNAEPSDDKDEQEKDCTEEVNDQGAQAAYITKPSMIFSKNRKAQKVTGRNSVPGPQNDARDSQDLPSSQWPQMVSARIEGFGPAVMINAQKVPPQMPHSYKASHNRKLLLDAINEIMEGCAKMTHILETGSINDDPTLSKAACPNLVSRKPKLCKNVVNRVFEKYGAKKTDSEGLPSADAKEENDKNFNLKNTCMSNEQMGITSNAFSWSTKTKPNKPPHKVVDQGTQTESRSAQTKCVSTDWRDILPSPAKGPSKPKCTSLISNKAQGTLQIDLPKSNVASLVQLLDERAQQQGTDEPKSPKQFSNTAGMGQGSGAMNGGTTESDMQPPTVMEDLPLPFQDNRNATLIHCRKTPLSIQLPKGSPNVRSVVDFFQRNAQQQDQNERTSLRLHCRSRGAVDQEPATFHSGDATEKAAAMSVVKPYHHTGNAESFGMATQTDISIGQGSVLHVDVPQNVSSLVQLLEENSKKGSKTVSYIQASKLARTALQRTTKNEVRGGKNMQASACHEDLPWPCQRPTIFRRTVSTPKKTK